MSVLDELRGLEGRVAARLNELRPMVEEYRELEAVARRLGMETERPAASETPSAAQSARTRTVRRGRSTAGSKRTTGKRSQRRTTRPASARAANGAGRGTRETQVAELVKERPGITVPEVGKALGVDPTNLYRIVRRLETSGAIKKDGRALQPA
jgi:hypothetical protein